MDAKEIAGNIILACSLVAAVVGLIELIFKPIRRLKKAAEARRERINNLNRLLSEHTICAEHTEQMETRLTSLERAVQQQAKAIRDSKSERYVLWRAQRAMLDGLKQLGANGLVTKAIHEMDDFSDKHMR